MARRISNVVCPKKYKIKNTNTPNNPAPMVRYRINFNMSNMSCFLLTAWCFMLSCTIY